MHRVSRASGMVLNSVHITKFGTGTIGKNYTIESGPVMIRGGKSGSGTEKDEQLLMDSLIDELETIQRNLKAKQAVAVKPGADSIAGTQTEHKQKVETQKTQKPPVQYILHSILAQDPSLANKGYREDLLAKVNQQLRKLGFGETKSIRTQLSRWKKKNQRT